jgi:cysteine desulfuration protein SufE
MPLAEKQRQIIARYGVIEDRHERLAAIVARGQKWPEVPAEARTEERMVRGCTTPVWLRGEVREGRCHFRISAGSSLIKGLGALLTELYDGETPAAVAAFEPDLLAGLGLDRHISPTRLNGLDQIRRAIRDFATAAAP